MIDWNIINAVFKIACTIFTVILVADWIDRYFMNEDMTIIESSSYYQKESDVFPVMSLCFKQTFSDSSHFKQIYKNIDGEKYEKYLLGEYFDYRMNSVDYDKVTTNVSDYIIAYSVYFKNGSSVLDTKHNLVWKPPYESYSWKSWEHFVKCFAFELIDPNVYYLMIYFHRDIYPDRIRPQAGGFAVMFHYPNQILASIHSVTRQWTPRDEKANYWMDLNIRGMNVVVRRHKNEPNDCVQNWQNFDNFALEHHIKSVGCKTAYQKTPNYWPLCNETEKMHKAQFPIEHVSMRPCKEIETINYQHLDSEAFTEERHVQNLQGRKWDKWFCVVWRFLNNRFVKTVSKRKIDIQSLVGYIGGYIGICTGLALAQVPEILVTIAACTKRFWKNLNKKQPADETHSPIKHNQVLVLEEYKISLSENGKFYASDC